MGSVDDLASLVPPPDTPVAGDGDWLAVEASLGVPIPGDFKDLLRRYGLGQFDDIALLTPFAPSGKEFADLVGRAHSLLPTFAQHREEWPDDFPYPLYPEPGGLLEWATTGNGDSLCWLVSDDPDLWPVVVWNIREGAERHDSGAVEFLRSYLSGERTVELLGPPPPVPWFEPFRDRNEAYIQLSDSDLPYLERLRVLRDALAPTEDRRSWDGGDQRQDQFKATGRDWLVMYESAYGHQIRLEYPPEDEQRARTEVGIAVRAMGCRVVRVTTRKGDVWSNEDTAPWAVDTLH